MFLAGSRSLSMEVHLLICSPSPGFTPHPVSGTVTCLTHRPFSNSSCRNERVSPDTVSLRLLTAGRPKFYHTKSNAANSKQQGLENARSDSESNEAVF